MVTVKLISQLSAFKVLCSSQSLSKFKEICAKLITVMSRFWSLIGVQELE